MPRYQSLADLKAAYDKGELTEPLAIDNDSISLYSPGGDGHPAHWTCEFGEDPATVLEQALDLLGIPHEHV